MFNILFVWKLQSIVLSKNEIYNILLMLNYNKCVKAKPLNKEQPVMFPLTEFEINLLTGFIYDKYLNDDIIPKFDEKGSKSIRTDSFIKEWLRNNPEYEGDKHSRTIIINEINRLKGINTSVLKSEYIVDLYDRYPGLKTKDYIHIIMEERKFTYEYAKKYFFKSKKR
jgi:hypothetical protein